MTINTNIQNIAQRIINAKAKMAKAGIDEHARDVVVCVKPDRSQAMRAIKLTKDALLALLKQLKEAGIEVRACYEAGPCGFPPRSGCVVALVEQQASSARFPCLAVAFERFAQAALRARLLLFGRGHVGARERFFASVEVRVEQFHQRERVERVGLLAFATAELLRGDDDVRDARLLEPAVQHEPKRWDELAETLPGWLSQLLKPMRETILQLDGQERALRKALEQKAPAKLPLAMGALTWALLLLEACDWKRFQNRRQVGANTGLCPGIEQSGTKMKQGSINRHGNRRMRVLLIELVWRLVRWQPNYPPVRHLVEGVARGAARRKLAVAAARRLAIDIWRLSTGRTTPEKLGLVMPAAATWQAPGQAAK